MSVPVVDFSQPITLRKLSNGGFVMLNGGHRMNEEASTIAAYSNGNDLMRDLSAIITPSLSASREEK